MFCKNCGKEMNDNQAICLNCGVKTGEGSAFCSNCGGAVAPGAEVCMNCGVAIKKAGAAAGDLGGKDKIVMALVAFFVGGIGIHNFMMGETKKGIVKAVNDVSYSLEPGKTIGIVGESGSGKSQSAMSILQLLDSNGYIASGEVIFEGRDLTKLSREEMYAIRGNAISVIFQEPMTSLNPVFSVDKQLSEPFIIHQGMSKAEAHEQALKMLYDVQIPNPEQVIRQYPHQLSGGMRQRVMIAMALACRPKILIADEPTTALDVTIQAQILRLMNELQAEKGTSIIFITHDLGVINEMADDVAVMYCGQVVEKADARTIFGNPEMSHPYTEGLMASIPRLDSVGSKIEPIPGVVPHPLNLPKGCKFAPRCKYCTGKCMEQEPPLTDVGNGQLIRCFYPNKEVRNSAEHKEITVHHES